MQKKGLEPSRCCHHRHLKPARLPIPPFLHMLVFSETECLHDEPLFAKRKLQWGGSPYEL